MTRQERQSLEAELSELDYLLSHTPESNPIDRMSLEARKMAIREEMEGAPIRRTMRASLTFQGKPVIAGHGIFAEFGAQAVNSFAGAVAAFAASLEGPLGTRGSLPRREEYELLIIGPALGSFGFELEEYQSQPELPTTELSIVGRAVERVSILMEATKRSDDDLADAISEADPRAVDALREFFRVVGSREATYALNFGDHVVRFTSVDQVNDSAKRLSRENIQEEQNIQGNFQGVLPKRRTFEFRVHSTGEIIAGKVGPKIAEAGTINRILDLSTEIRVLVTRIGDGRPRYVLLECRDLGGSLSSE